MTTTTASDTTVNEIAAGIYRISTPVPPSAMPGGFTFNQFLIVDEEPLLFHTGMRRLFPAVREAVARVIDPATLRWVGFSHVEADECGALPDWLAIAPNAQTGLQPGRGDDLARRHDRPAGARDGRRRGAGAGPEQADALAGRPAPAPQLGVRVHVRIVDADAAVPATCSRSPAPTSRR